MAASFGEFFRESRLRLGKTLREFCEENRFDPGNISRLERDLLPAPASGERLEQYASALGLIEGSSEWHDFLSLAAVSAGRIPQDLLDDEAIVRRLPVLFRTLQGERVSPDMLDQFIDRLRRS